MKKRSGRGEVLRSLVGLNIKRFRVNSGFSQEELAEKAKISVPYLGAIERPENASAQDVKKITVKLIKDITILVNQSVKMMNTVVRESNKPN